MTQTFKNYWIQKNKSEALTKSEVLEVRAFIEKEQEKKVISSKIIKKLQINFPKLTEKYRAERAYWTESKVIDTQKVAEIGDELEVETYKIITSPHPCQLCKDKARKTYTSKEMQKSGYGNTIPWHPGCYCIAIPQ